MRRAIGCLLLLSILLLGASLISLIPPPDDPLAEFINENGGITVPGGLPQEKWKAIIDYLFRPQPKPYIEYTSWLPKQSAYPTADLERHTIQVPNLNVFVPAPASPPPQNTRSPDLLKPLIDGLRWFFSLDWLIGRAAAAPTFVNIGAIAASTGVDVTPGLPASMLIDDIIIVLGFVRDVDDSVTMTGYTAMTGTPFDRSTVERYWIFWKRHTGTESAQVFDKSTATGDTYAQAAAYRGATTATDPWEVKGAAATGTADPALCTTITSLTADALIVVPLGYADNNNAAITTTGTDPLAYTEHYTASGTGADGATTFSEAPRTAAGATGTVSVNFDVAVTAGDGWGCMVLALKSSLFSVFDDAQCTASTVFNDADCWSTTTNGDGNRAPASGDTLILDNGNGATSGTLGGSLDIGAGGIYFCSAANMPTGACAGAFGVTLTIGTNTLTNTGDWELNDGGGTVSISTGTIDGGAATLLGASDLSVTGTATLTWNGLTISGATLAKGTAALNVQGGLTMSGGDLTSTSGAVTVTGAMNISAVGSAIDFGSEAWTVSGAFDCESTDTAVWEAGTGTITFDSATGDASYTPCNFTTEAHFNNTTFNSSAGATQTFTLATRSLRWGGTLTVTDTSGGTTLAKATLGLNGGALTISGTAAAGITSTSGDAVITTVSISTATAFIDFGSEAWTVSGTWTNATTSASWDAGTGSPTVIFSSATGGTMTFAGANLAEAEFNSVTFQSSAGTAQTFTMSTRGLRWLTDLAINDISGTTELVTSGLSIGNSADTPNLSMSASGTLTASSSTVTVSLVDASTTCDGVACTIDVTTGAWTISGDWNTSGALAVFNQGTTSTYTFDATATITLLSTDNAFSNLTITPGGGNTVTLSSALIVTNALTITTGTFAKSTFAITSAGSLTMSGGDLTSTSGDVAITGNVNISSAASAIDFGSEAWTVSGTWTNASTDGAVWEAGSGTITFDSATGGTMTFAGANLSEAEFDDVTFTSSAGTPQTFTMSTRALRWATTLTISDGSSTTELATSDLGLSTGAISVGNGGILTANASTVSITSFTMTGGSSGVLTLTTGAWTLSGSWDSSGAGSTFTQGSSTVTMSGAGTTITLRSGDSTFNNLTISAAGTVTLASDMTIAGTLTVNSGAVLALATFVVAITTLAALAGGITAGASGAKSVSSDVTVDSTGFFSFGGAPWTFSGQWTNNSTNAAWDAGSDTVTFDDATAGTMTFAGANLAEAEFNSLTFSSGGATPQTFTMATRSLRIAATLTATDGVSTTTLDTSNLNLQANSIQCATSGIILIGTGNFLGLVTFNIDGSLTMDGITVGNMYMNRTAGSGTIDITLWTAWTVGADVDVRWTFSPSVAGDTWEFVLEDVIAATSYDLIRNAITIDTQTSVGTIVTLSEAGGWAAGDAMEIDETSVCGGDRYWVGGTGNWSDTARWSSTSGGASGCSIPTAAEPVFFDAASGAGTATVDVNAAMLSFDSTGNSITTIAIGTFNFAVSGAIVHAAGSITIGTSAGTGLTATGNLTISGTANINAGVAAEIVDIDGNVSISSATAYIDLGSGTWSVGGTWTNSTTSASWDAGGGTLTFDSATGGTMTFAGANLAEPEFNNVTFESSAGTAQTFTMSTRALRWSGTLQVQDLVSSTTQLSTADLGLSTGSLGLRTGGILVANASTVTVSDVLMNLGGGTITVTIGSWSITNAWDSSGAGSVFNEGTTSLYTFTAGGSITMLGTDNTFSAVTSSGGSRTLATNIVVTNALTISGGTFAKSTFTLSLGSLTMSGGDLTSTSGAVTITGVVNISSTSSAIDFGSETWAVSGTWTNASTDSAWDAGTGSMLFDSATGGTMTFAGANLAEAEFNSVTFTSSAGTVQTFTMATRGLRWLTTLMINDTVSTTTLATSDLALGAAADTPDLTVSNGGILTANVSTVIVANVTMTGGASGVITLTTGEWTVSGNWDTSGAGSVFTKGTSTVTMDGAATIAILNSANGFYNLTTSGTITQITAIDVSNALLVSGTLATADFAISGGATLTVPNAGILTANASTVAVSSVTMTGGVSGTITLTSGSWTVSGNWNTSGAGSTFTEGTSTITMSGAGTAITLQSGDSTFNNLTISAAGTVSLLSDMTVAGTLTVNSGAVLALATFVVVITTLAALAGGITAGASGAKSVSSDTTIDSTGFFSFGGAPWTFSGAWTNNSTNASWDAGSDTVTFDDATAGTMTFAGSNLAEAEFNSATFTSSAGTPQTFTMVTRGLRWLTTLSIADGSSTTALATSDLALGNSADTPNLSIGNGGILTANSSIVSAIDVTMTGGSSGVITLTTGTWGVAGNWNTSGAGSTFTAGTSSVTMSGAVKTVSLLNSTNGFDTLIVGGSVAQGTNLWSRVLAVNGTLTMTGFDIIFKQLTVTPGSIVDGLITVTDFQVDNDEAAARTTISSFVDWTVNLRYEWVHTSISPTTLITFTIGGNTPSRLFAVTKNAVPFTDGTIDGTGNVVFQILGGDPTMVVTITPPPPVGGPGPVLPPIFRPPIPIPEFDIIVAGLTVVMFILALSSRRDPRRFMFSAIIVGLLGLTASSLLVSAIPQIAQGIMLVIMGAYALAITVLPSKHQRSRLLWVLLGAAALILGASTTLVVFGAVSGFLTVETAWYALAAITASAIIGTVFVKDERWRFRMAIVSVALLGVLTSGASPIAMPVVLDINLGYILLAFAVGGLALALVPTNRQDRRRVAWLIFTVVAFALWFFLVL